MGWRTTAWTVSLAISLPAYAEILPAGSEFQINTYTTSTQYTNRQAVCRNEAGDFVVVWDGRGEDDPSTTAYGVFGQRFHRDGTRAGTEFQANTYTTGDQFFSEVACDPTGNFVL